MKLKRSELPGLLKGLDAVMKFPHVKFSYLAVRNKQVVQEELKTIQESIKPAAAFQEYEKKRIGLCEEFCIKDKAGKPVITANSNYAGLDVNEEWKTAHEALLEEYKEALDERKKQMEGYAEFLKEEVELKLITIPIKMLPDSLTGELLEGIILLVPKS